MKRIHVLAAAILALAAGASAVAAQAQPSARASRAPTVELRSTRLGKILATGTGFTLYEFTRDSRNRNSCAPMAGCQETWPPLRSTGRPTAGHGVKASLLSTITLRSGVKQVTYAGHPLYRYSGDSAPGETSYVGESAFGGRWYAINAAGSTVR